MHTPSYSHDLPNIAERTSDAASRATPYPPMELVYPGTQVSTPAVYGDNSHASRALLDRYEQANVLSTLPDQYASAGGPSPDQLTSVPEDDGGVDIIGIWPGSPASATALEVEEAKATLAPAETFVGTAAVSVVERAELESVAADAEPRVFVGRAEVDVLDHDREVVGDAVGDIVATPEVVAEADRLAEAALAAPAGETRSTTADAEALYEDGLRKLAAEFPEVDEQHEGLRDTGREFIQRHPADYTTLLRSEIGQLLFTGLMHCMASDAGQSDLGKVVIPKYVEELRDKACTPEQLYADQVWSDTWYERQVTELLDQGLVNATINEMVERRMEQDQYINRARDLLENYRSGPEAPFRVVVFDAAMRREDILRRFEIDSICFAGAGRIFITWGLVKGFLTEPDNPNHWKSANALSHEFAHTQLDNLCHPWRQVGYYPGTVLIERIADVVAAHATYPHDDKLWYYEEPKILTDRFESLGINRTLTEHLLRGDMLGAMKHLVGTIGLRATIATMCVVPTGIASGLEIDVAKYFGTFEQIADTAEAGFRARSGRV